MGTLYASNAVHATHGAARWVIIVCIYLYSVFFASQHQGVCAGDSTAEHPRKGYGGGARCQLVVQLVRGVYLPRPVGEERLRCVLLVRGMLRADHDCVFLFHGRDEGEELGRD